MASNSISETASGTCCNEGINKATTFSSETTSCSSNHMSDRIQTLESLVRELQEENRQLKIRLEEANDSHHVRTNHETETRMTKLSTSDGIQLASIQPPSLTSMKRSLPDCDELIVDEQEEYQQTLSKQKIDDTIDITKKLGADSVETRIRDEGYTKQLLDKDTIQRYSRQMLIIGTHGQQRLQQSSVLVIGAGGIGSTVLLYLAGAGIGTIDVMDHDVVEISNLHRQIIHYQPGMQKATSAQQVLLRFNPTIQCRAICEKLTTHNAIQYISNYDVIIDATDNVTSRYIINDACVLLNKPLVSGSAITTQGQLTVYKNDINADLCCYRCMYPNPAVQKECQSCNDAGVLGPVPGLIGILQAMETIKLITATGSGSTTGSTKEDHCATALSSIMQTKLLMYDGISCSFMTITKPKKNPNCSVCGNHPTITSMHDTCSNLQKVNAANSCSVPQSVHTIDYDVTCIDYYQTIMKRNIPHILIDVRVRVQFEICSLVNSINIPLEDIVNDPTNAKKHHILTELSNHNTITLPIYCICRRGIASREAVRILQDAVRFNWKTNGTNYDDTTTGSNNDSDHHHHPNTSNTNESHQYINKKPPKILNIVGGLVAWQQQVDCTFPNY